MRPDPVRIAAGVATVVAAVVVAAAGAATAAVAAAGAATAEVAAATAAVAAATAAVAAATAVAVADVIDSTRTRTTRCREHMGQPPREVGLFVFHEVRRTRRGRGLLRRVHSRAIR